MDQYTKLMQAMNDKIYKNQSYSSNNRPKSSEKPQKVVAQPIKSSSKVNITANDYNSHSKERTVHQMISDQ